MIYLAENLKVVISNAHYMAVQLIFSSIEHYVYVKMK